MAASCGLYHSCSQNLAIRLLLPNYIMPTNEEIVTAEEQTDETPPAETLDEDAVKAHPMYKELEGKHAAARKGMDTSNLTNKELKAEVAKFKTLAGVEEEVEAKGEEPITREELEGKLWKLQHSEDIGIYSDEEYEQDIKEGIPSDKALKYAKLRYQANPDQARLERQKQMASGSSANTRTLDSTDITEKDREDMAKWGYSEAAILKQKQLKKERA